MKQEELNEILAKHKLWLEKKEGGERADLSFSDLRGADLRFSDLRGADLRFSDLRGAILRFSDLHESDPSAAKLSGAKLRGAKLRWVNLRGANLRGADLSGANLRGANTQGVIEYPLFSFRGGSTGRYSNYDAELDIVHCGCWNGTLAEFEARVASVYPDPQQPERSSYDRAIAELKKQLNLNLNQK